MKRKMRRKFTLHLFSPTHQLHNDYKIAKVIRHFLSGVSAVEKYLFNCSSKNISNSARSSKKASGRFLNKNQKKTIFMTRGLFLTITFPGKLREGLKIGGKNNLSHRRNALSRIIRNDHQLIFQSTKIMLSGQSMPKV